MIIHVDKDNPLYGMLSFMEGKDKVITELTFDKSELTAELNILKSEMEYLKSDSKNLSDRMIHAAKYAMFLNIPYLWDGSWVHKNPDRAKHFDCSALMQSIHAYVGISIPRSSKYQSESGILVAYEDMKPGCLVFFDTNGDGIVNHVGMYLGDGMMIHTANTTDDISIVVIADRYPTGYVTSRSYI